MNVKKYFHIAMVLLLISSAKGQSHDNTSVLVVDKQGIMRWKTSGKEARFFGVNYTTPFAHAYRAHKQLGIDLEAAIRQDVYHLSRLGLNAFRVHVWDVEISDREGNLMANEHLRLFDFLLAELKRRGIYALITPIAFWGNGYPERDEKLPGFSAYYGKAASTTNKEAIKAQERYLQQFFSHKNPYTGLTYGEDPNIVAAEINNEPDHGGDEQQITTYINTLKQVIKKTGWKKPIFYNISQNPSKAAAVARSAADGFSFQWYPVGLVAGGSLQGNFLPHVDRYTIPFDTIPGFLKKPKMVYEFDAADQVQPILFPAMARSFREAGFQWATQFAYDPLAIAYANTEYQTHYLNLAYTPAKAISLLIAGYVFRSLPSGGHYGKYPQSASFGPFKLDYLKQLSLMNTDTAFYYTTTTEERPVDPTSLRHLAGVGSSPVIDFPGTGAYFLDKLENGVWRLELMPDVIALSDPFETPSLKKEVNRVTWNFHQLKINLTDLGADFQIHGLNEGNTVSEVAKHGTVVLGPGTYLLTRKGVELEDRSTTMGTLSLREFAAPKPVYTGLFVKPAPPTLGSDSLIHVYVAGEVVGDSLLMDMERWGSFAQQVPMLRIKPGLFAAPIPTAWRRAGRLNYRVWIKNGSTRQRFPDNYKGEPKAWDDFSSAWWTYDILQQGNWSLLYRPENDRRVFTFPSHHPSIRHDYVIRPRSSAFVLNVTLRDADALPGFALQLPIQPARLTNVFGARELIIRGGMEGIAALPISIGLIDSDGQCFSKEITLKSTDSLIRIPLDLLQQGKTFLLPRPYPGFLPQWFLSSLEKMLDIQKIDKLQIYIERDNLLLNKSLGLYLEAIWLA